MPVYALEPVRFAQIQSAAASYAQMPRKSIPNAPAQQVNQVAVELSLSSDRRQEPGAAVYDSRGQKQARASARRRQESRDEE